MSQTKQALLGKLRRTVTITLEGEQIPVTVKRITAADLLAHTPDLVSVYGALVAAAPVISERDGQAYALTRAVLLAGVVDPPLSVLPSPTDLTPEDLGMENWPALFEGVASVSDLGLLFRDALSAAEGITAAV